MKNAVAKLLVEASEGIIEIYEDYSGRGMFGAKTTAVTYSDLGDLLAAVAEAGRRIGLGETIADEDGNELRPDDFVQEMAKVGCDQLGRGMIAY